MSRQQKVYTQEFKLAAVGRMASGENVVALARELGVLRKCLYVWRDQLRVGGPEGLGPRKRGPKPRAERIRDSGDTGHRSGARQVPEVRPPPVLGAVALPGPAAMPAATAPLVDAQAQIAALERKVGQQALDLDFFRAALRHFRATRQPSDGSGVPASTRSSEP